MDPRKEKLLGQKLWQQEENIPSLEPDKLARTLFWEKLLAIVVLLLLVGFVLQFWIYQSSEFWAVDTSPSMGLTLAISLVVGVGLVLLLLIRWRNLRRELGWRIRVDRQLRLLKAAAETMEIGITISDIDGRIQYVNRAEAEMHGQSPSDLIGREARCFAPEELWNRQSVDQVQEAGLSKRESLNIRSDGTVFPVQLISDVVCNKEGAPVGIVTSCEDITDRNLRETELRESRQRLKGLARHLEKIRDEERSAIAHEIHNDLGAALTVLKLDLALLESRLGSDGDLQIEKLHAMEENIDGMIDRIRRLSRQLRPFLLDDAGLEAAIEWYSKDFSSRTDIPIDLDIPELPEPIESDAREVLFRCFQEGVTNALRHASPNRIQVKMDIGEAEISITVADDGVGCPGDPTRYSNAFGLLALRERAESAGGRFEFLGIPGEGATLKVSIPR